MGLRCAMAWMAVDARSIACGISDVCERGVELFQSSYALEDLLY